MSKLLKVGIVLGGLDALALQDKGCSRGSADGPASIAVATHQKSTQHQQQKQQKKHQVQQSKTQKKQDNSKLQALGFAVTGAVFTGVGLFGEKDSMKRVEHLSHEERKSLDNGLRAAVQAADKNEHYEWSTANVPGSADVRVIGTRIMDAFAANKAKLTAGPKPCFDPKYPNYYMLKAFHASLDGKKVFFHRGADEAQCHRLFRPVLASEGGVGSVLVYYHIFFIVGIGMMVGALLLCMGVCKKSGVSGKKTAAGESFLEV